MIKLWRNSKKVTSGLKESAWNHIDSLYSKLEEGKATKDELKQIDDISQIIMNTTNNNKKEASTQEELNNLTQRDLEMLIQTISMNSIKKETATTTGAYKEEKKLRLYRKAKYTGISIAASILLMWGVSFYMNNKMIAGMGAIASNNINCRKDSVLHLTDGSTIYMTAGSNLIIDKNFGKKDRVVNLTGEAFFEIAKDKEKAFIVKTKEVNTIVHGTSFNIVAYEGTVESHVLIRTGYVEVVRGEQSFGKFHAGDRVIYNKVANIASFDTVNPENIGIWRDGGFILEDATIEELKVKIRNRFHLELIIEENAMPVDARINYYSYKPGQSGIANVMNSICTIYGVRYEINDNRVVISR